VTRLIGINLFLFHLPITIELDFASVAKERSTVTNVACLFSLVVADRTYTDLSANIKQNVGVAYAPGSLEVSRPQSFDGPLNYQAYREAVIGGQPSTGGKNVMK
jgi:hypothetical protein